MATDTAPKQTDTKTPTTTQAKTKSKPRAKTAAKSRTRTTTARRRTAAKSRKPATARAPRSETTAAPRTRATAVNGSREVFAGIVDAQEKAVTTLVDYQTRAAELSQIPGATAIAGAQAQLLRGATDAYVSAARAFLK